MFFLSLIIFLAVESATQSADIHSLKQQLAQQQQTQVQVVQQPADGPSFPWSNMPAIRAEKR